MLDDINEFNALLDLTEDNKKRSQKLDAKNIKSNK